MTRFFLNPSARFVAGFFALAAVFLIAGALMMNLGGEDMAASGFLSLLIGLTVLAMALTSFGMRKLNLKYGPPQA